MPDITVLYINFLAGKTQTDTELVILLEGLRDAIRLLEADRKFMLVLREFRRDVESIEEFLRNRKENKP